MEKNIIAILSLIVASQISAILALSTFSREVFEDIIKKIFRQLRISLAGINKYIDSDSYQNALYPLRLRFVYHETEFKRSKENIKINESTLRKINDEIEILWKELRYSYLHNILLFCLILSVFFIIIVSISYYKDGFCLNLLEGGIVKIISILIFIKMNYLYSKMRSRIKGILINIDNNLKKYKIFIWKIKSIFFNSPFIFAFLFIIILMPPRCFIYKQNMFIFLPVSLIVYFLTINILFILFFHKLMKSISSKIIKNIKLRRSDSLFFLKGYSLLEFKE